MAIERGVNLVDLNVSGNYKNKSKTKIIKQNLNIASKKGKKKVASTAMKVSSKGARNYGRYIAPTVGLFKKAGAIGMGALKLGARFPGTGLALTGLYYGGKALAKKQKGLEFPEFRQFNKKGRKII